jgi:hypothetical protein
MQNEHRSPRTATAAPHSHTRHPQIPGCEDMVGRRASASAPEQELPALVPGAGVVSVLTGAVGPAERDFS